MLTACNESGKTNDISKNGQDKKQAEKLEINTKKDSDKEEEAKEAKEDWKVKHLAEVLSPSDKAYRNFN